LTYEKWLYLSKIPLANFLHVIFQWFAMWKIVKVSTYQFLCPWDWRLWGILFLSCLSFFNSVLLSSAKNFTHGYYLWMVSTRALISHKSVPFDKYGTRFFLPWCLTHLFKTLTLAISIERYALWLWSLIFHMSIPCDKTFQWLPKDLSLWPWPWYLTYFNLGHICWMVATRALIFHMSVHCDKTFPWIPTNLMWPWR
jgi:hypothetical protein